MEVFTILLSQMKELPDFWHGLEKHQFPSWNRRSYFLWKTGFWNILADMSQGIFRAGYAFINLKILVKFV